MHNGAVGEGGEHEGETYILLVDDDENAGAHLESLNSQTLYIDSSSLANGDLSNMVLMTGPPHTTEGEQVSDAKTFDYKNLQTRLTVFQCNNALVRTSLVI